MPVDGTSVDGSQVESKHYHCLYVASFRRIRKRGLLLGQCCSAWFLHFNANLKKCILKKDHQQSNNKAKPCTYEQ